MLSLRIRMLRLSLPVGLFSAIFCGVTIAYGQMPGYWEKTIICTHCTQPVGVDFSDQSTGVLAIASRQLGSGSFKHFETTIYATADAGKTWNRKIDTIRHPIGRGNRLRLHGSHLVVSGITAALHSDDYGDSVHAFPTEFVQEFDFHSSDPSTLFRVTQPDDDLHRMQFIVSRDSGKSYSTLSTLETPDYNIISARLRDTNEIWALLGGIYYPNRDTMKPGRLVYSTDQGRNWTDVFPFDTAGTSWGNTQFGLSPLNWAEGMALGSRPGSVYLLQNFYRQGKPDAKRLDLLYTTDYGKTWTGDSSHSYTGPPYFDHILLRNSSGTRIWTVFTDTQTVAYSPDNGKTWSHDSVTFKGANITNMVWKDSVTGYVLTWRDSTVGFWKFIPNVSGVEHYDNYPVNSFRLLSSVLNGAPLRVLTLRQLSGQMTVSDILGRVVWSKSIDSERAETLEFDVPSVAGVYFLTYSEGGIHQSVRYIHR